MHSTKDMDGQEVLKYVDELVFAKTGKHLDSLQTAILKGVFNGQKYTEIAKEYNCSTGHAKDEAYKLWQTLSEALGEDLNKSNVRAAIERIGYANTQYQIIGNPVQISSINLCSAPSQDAEIDNPELVAVEDLQIEKKAEQIAAVKRSKLELIPRLLKLGLTPEQIAQVIDLPLNEIQ